MNDEVHAPNLVLLPPLSFFSALRAYQSHTGEDSCQKTEIKRRKTAKKFEYRPGGIADTTR